MLTIWFGKKRQPRNCCRWICQGNSQQMDVIPGDTFDCAGLETGSIVMKLQFEFLPAPYHHQAQFVAFADYMHPLQRETYAIKYLLGAQVLISEAEGQHVFVFITAGRLTPHKTLLPAPRFVHM